MVTCGDGRRWTCCLLFASRGSGVRVPLAPPGQKPNSNSGAREYSSKVQQPGPREMPHTRSSWALPSRAAAHRSQGLGTGFRATKQERCLCEGPVPLARRPAGSVLNLPFQGRLLPLRQRVSAWQAISVTQGEIPRDVSYVHDAHNAEYSRLVVGVGVAGLARRSSRYGGHGPGVTDDHTRQG
jgi:hypothetical protein